MTTDRACTRCGRSEDLERHHIKPRYVGGGDEDSNLEDRCRPCHQYTHALDQLEPFLEGIKTVRYGDQGKVGQPDRVAVVELRLARLIEYNTVEAIRERGTYQSYWEDGATHVLPPRINTPAEKEATRQLRKRVKSREFDFWTITYLAHNGNFRIPGVISW